MKASQNDPACFTVTVKRFKDIFTTTIRNRGTLYRMTWDKPHPLVRATLDKRTRCVKKIRILPGRVTLRFQVASPDNDTTHYSPVGIAFVQKAKRARNYVQLAASPRTFPSHTMNLDGENRAVSITADFSDSASADQGLYEFYLIIQRENDGALGIIDPPMDHDHTIPPS